MGAVYLACSALPFNIAAVTIGDKIALWKQYITSACYDFCILSQCECDVIGRSSHIMTVPVASKNVLGSIDRACDLQSLAYEASNAQKEHETTQGGIHDAESQPVQVDSVRTLNLLLGSTRST